MSKKLTVKQRKFIAEYIKTGNATQSAIAAGYSKATAYSIGQENLKKPEILKAVEKRMKKFDVTVDNVVQELAKMGFANMLDYVRTTDQGDAFVDLSALSREQAAAIQEVTVEEYTEGRGENKRDIRKTKFKLADKRGSLELLGKHLELFTEKVKHSGSIETVDMSRLSDEQLGTIEHILTQANGRTHAA